MQVSRPIYKRLLLFCKWFHIALTAPLVATDSSSRDSIDCCCGSLAAPAPLSKRTCRLLSRLKILSDLTMLGRSRERSESCPRRSLYHQLPPSTSTESECAQGAASEPFEVAEALNFLSVSLPTECMSSCRISCCDMTASIFGLQLAKAFPNVNSGFHIQGTGGAQHFSAKPDGFFYG